MSSKGKGHPVQDLVQKVREVFLELGFDEIENQVFVPEDDVYKQYGQEAPVILERVYYLAGLPRPDIGLSDEKVGMVMDILDRTNNQVPSPEIEVKLKKIFRKYREGSIEGDDLIETIVNEFDIDSQHATQIIDLFPEFKNLQPVAEKQTLRSHMTGAWFPTIAAFKDTRNLPMKLFSVGMRFRREQKLDATHLRAHYGGSMVIVDKKLDIEDGKKITEQILNKLEFGNIKFVKKKATSNYYVPDTEYEVYSGDVEVADIGLYNPESLAKYDIDYDVFNLGFGLERILMVKQGIGDVRELLYPQFYKVVELTDEEIVSEIEMVDIPKTDAGKKLAKLLEKTARKNADADSKCSFKAYEGEFNGMRLKVEVYEDEENKKLLGPAALNEVYVHDGEITAVPPKDSEKRKGSDKLDKELSEIEKKGVDTGITILRAISNFFTYKIEKEIRDGKTSGTLQVGMAKGPSDVNIRVGEQARRFIESHNKRIFIKGPVFMNVKYGVKGD